MHVWSIVFLHVAAWRSKTPVNSSLVPVNACVGVWNSNGTNWRREGKKKKKAELCSVQRGALSLPLLLLSFLSFSLCMSSFLCFRVSNAVLFYGVVRISSFLLRLLYIFLLSHSKLSFFILLRKTTSGLSSLFFFFHWLFRHPPASLPAVLSSIWLFDTFT